MVVQETWDKISSSVPFIQKKWQFGADLMPKKFSDLFLWRVRNRKSRDITKEWYTDMLTQIFPEDSESVDSSTVFQQDGAPAHTSRMAMEFLKNRFPNRLISKNSDFLWPPRSLDLNPLDFFFWGFMKQKIKEANPRSLDEIKTSIASFVNSITEEMLQRVNRQFCSRVTRCIQARGGLFEA